MTRRMIIGISGASGVIYGIETLKILRSLEYETHLIMTEAALKNIEIETQYPIDDVKSYAAVVHGNDNLSSPLASGSFQTMGMIIAPCTMKSLSAIANSYSHTLLVRAADVCLKERRKLVLLVRETPLHRGHLGLMIMATDMGAVIMPPVPAFYHQPETIMDIVHHTIGKCLDYFHIDHQLYRRWEGR